MFPVNKTGRTVEISQELIANTKRGQAAKLPILSVSDFVAVLNQTLEFAYPSVIIVGELANFKVSKNKWVYFDLKDEFASVKFFGTVYILPGPLEDGLMLQVRGAPRLHPQFGFSINVQNIQLVGEGSLKRVAALLEAKLRSERLFDPARKRPMPYPPRCIGLVASEESAAYADFIKIINARWDGVEISLADVQVQGEAAPDQIIAAIQYFNQSAQPPEVLVITRGGGSAEDLAAFNTEQVTRAVAASRIPTMVAIGHEVDISLAELAADQRASTPSNAAELLVPDKRDEQKRLRNNSLQLGQLLSRLVSDWQAKLMLRVTEAKSVILQYLQNADSELQSKQNILFALNPEAVLRRGYAIVRKSGVLVRSIKQVKTKQLVDIQLQNGSFKAEIK